MLIKAIFAYFRFIKAIRDSLVKNSFESLLRIIFLICLMTAVPVLIVWAFLSVLNDMNVEIIWTRLLILWLITEVIWHIWEYIASLEQELNVLITESILDSKSVTFTGNRHDTKNS